MAATPPPTMTRPARVTTTGRAWLVVAAAGVLLLAVVAMWPARTRVGVNYEVAEHRIPLWRKTWQFLDRDRQTRMQARRILGGIAGDSARAVAALRWTTAHVRDYPADTAVVDDHVWSIIERCYGANDQQADVFTTLLTYADVPAFWVLIGPGRPALPISLVLVDGRWRVFDVHHEIAFRNRDGQLATPAQLAADPDLIRRSAAGRVSDVDSYLRWFAGFQPPPVPAALRARLQMPGPRLGYELRRLLRLGRSAGISPQ